jgi:branched-subunit amino acid aminotransferase/4-amino-4-deoxychorismate lyase
VDGRLQPTDEAAVRADDSAFSEGRGCYTSARVEAGRARFAERHVRRLVRGAAALGLGAVDTRAVLHAFQDLGTACFGEGAGVVRVQLSRDAEGRQHLVATARDLGDDAPRWRAITSALTHEGPVVVGGHKLSNRVVLALAGDEATRAGVDDALLYDCAGRLVELGRSNVVIVDEAGALVTPPRERGSVAGIALEVIAEHRSDLRERDLRSADVLAAREILAVNCVRGVRPIVELDGKPVGHPDGPGLAGLREAFHDHDA